MLCLKCGKETRGEQVFCEDCLQAMQTNPVKPGTVVQLPVRKDKPPVRKAARKPRVLPPEEQIPQLRKLIRRLAIAVGVLSLLLCIAAAAAVHSYFREDANKNIGKNYTTVGTGPQVPAQ